MSHSTSISLYFHVPFCTHKCGYCHFFVLPDKPVFKKQYLESLEREWQLRLPDLKNKKIVSIYFGGGTPSLLGPEALRQILQWIQNDLGYDPSIEITLEANPENVTESLMLAFAQAGINRVSLGVQTLSNTLLKKLDRQHDAERAIKAIWSTYQAGIQNLTIDLMYDLPHQTLAIWEETLNQVASLPIRHLSLYNLTIEPHTAFFKERKVLEKVTPDPEISLKMYEMAQDKLTSKGLFQYEISAFASPGFHSRHNTGYWTGRPFIGFGPSAFSYYEGKRFRNVAHLKKYADQLKEGTFPIDFVEKLDPQASLRELLAIRLRLLEGVDLDLFSHLENESLLVLKKLEQEEYIRKNGHHLSLTKKGILFYDTVATELI